jgi:hypothetical protein
MTHTTFCRTIKTVALFSLLGLATLGLSQCRLVGDTVTGVDVDATTTVNGRSDCVRDCNDSFKDGQKAEDNRHKDALRACGSNKACKDAENVKHKRNHEALVDAMQACKRACYNEGSGSGGR